MLNKKLVMLVIIIILALTISAVSAAENATNDVVCIEKTTEVLNNDDGALARDNSSFSTLEEKEVISSSSEVDTNMSLLDDDVLDSSPSYTDYNVNISDVEVYYGINKKIWMSISSPKGIYDYDFYFRVYDSNNNLKINQRNHDRLSHNITTSYQLNGGTLGIGVYTIKIENTYDSHVMDTATLTIKSVPYSVYSVDVSDTTIEYWSNESIFISISPAVSYTYGYDFYFRVYDSNNNLKINNRIYGSDYSYNKTYSIDAATLEPGVYTIRIENTNEGHVMDTATLTVISVPYSAYSVNIGNASMNYGYDKSILMYISPASSYICKYDFYLKFYDSDNVEKISQRYSSTSSTRSETYSIGAATLNPGVYSIKIVNYYDNHVMDTATLTVNILSHTDYSVNVSDTSIDFESSGTIKISIVPAYFNTSYYYDFYLKVFDSSDVEKISKLYRDYVPKTNINHTIKVNELNPGFYTIKIINHADNYVMDTANLIVKSVPYSAYSVSVNDVYIDFNSSGKIVMDISSTSNYLHKYDFYLKVYDSNNVEKISSRINGTHGNVLANYVIGANELRPGLYTIKLLNFDDNHVMDTAELTIGPVYVANKYKNVKINAPYAYYNQNKKITYSFEGNLNGCFKIYKGNKLIFSKKFNTNERINNVFKYKKHSYSYAINKLKDIGIYTIKITDSNGDVIAQSRFKIVKAPTILISEDFSTKMGLKETIYLSVYDKNWNSDGIGGTAKFRINCKNYKANVKNGLAEINVKFPFKLKNYKCIVQYLGDNHYKSSSKKFTIHVKKDKSYVEVDSFIVTPGKKITIQAKVTSYYDDAKVKSGTVNFEINGKTYKAKIINGIAKLTINAPNNAKKYYCKAEHIGDKKIDGSTTKFTITVKNNKITTFTVVVPVELYKKHSKNYGIYSVKTYKYVKYEYHKRTAIQTTGVYKNGKLLSNYDVKYYWHYSFGGGSSAYNKNVGLLHYDNPDTFYNVMHIDWVRVTVWL